ncbi:MAG: PRK06851 family protein [Symbiobacteriia bacterium]
MSKKGKIRRIFPGGNTPNGFHSFYDYITPPDTNKIYILKGGPGVGKSTFMRKIAEELVDRGFDAEFLHCSSDNNSLDGIRIPAIGVTMIDGTAPHIVDPKNPGAVDEIIHLGDYWDEAGMRQSRDEILASNREVGRLFARAYDNLRAAKAYYDELQSYYRQALGVHWLNTKTEELLVEIFGPKRLNKPGSERHLFASAITPEGPRHHLDTLVGPMAHRYIWTGEPGTGKSTMIKKLADAAVQKGYQVELFHCPMDPKKVDHVLIPELNLALVKSIPPHTFPSRLGDGVIDTDVALDDSLLRPNQDDIAVAGALYEAALARGVSFIKRAKEAHDRMETYYIPNIRFDEVEARRQKVLARILELAEERSAAPLGD